MRRFFIQSDLIVGHEVQIPPHEAEHMRSSLRLNKGDRVEIFNGEKVVIARIEHLNNERSTALVEEEIALSSDNRRVVLAFCMLRQMQLNELVIQKATELGIAEFVPIKSEYGQLDVERVWPGKLMRLGKIMIEACKQSERVDLMNFGDPQNLVEYLKNCPAQTKLMLTLPRQTDLNVKSIKEFTGSNVSDIALLIGPEGGFSKKEHTLATEAGWQLVSLGDVVLRAETAAIVAAGLFI